MTIMTPAQCRAARALLNWRSVDLEERSGVNKSTISAFETETGGRPGKIGKMQEAFDREGIVFLDDDGVKRKTSTLVYMKGDTWFVDLLEDVYFTLRDRKDAELLVEMGDDSITAQRPDVLGRYRKIRNAGARMRQLICEEDRYMLGPVCEYRWVPRQFYKNWVTLIYGDKVAISLDDETKCAVFLDKDLAERRRNDFDFKWSFLKEPDRREAIHEYF